jgi:integrase
MAREVAKLPAVNLRKLKAGMHNDGGGLYLQVTASGARSWIYRFKAPSGRTREMGLGSLNTISLAEAREVARECRKLCRDGVDPIEQRRAKLAAARIESAKIMTFDACAERYIAAQRPGWRNKKHASQWPNTIATYVSPVFGAVPVQAVDVGLVMKALEPIWHEKPETASRVRGRIESVLDWAAARGYRQGENPARWRGHLENLLPKKTKVRRVKHHAALPYPEIGNFMVELRQQEGIAARALDFTILTVGPRTGGVIGAEWSEIDWQARLWTIPGERMKGGQEHKVPLSDAAMAILAEMQDIRQNDFIFPGAKAGRPISNMAMLMTLRRMGRGGITVHGFRSTFKDWASDCTNFPREIIEMAMAHAIEDRVEAAYRRGEALVKRRQLMEAWAKHCATTRINKPSDNVVSMARA